MSITVSVLFNLLSHLTTRNKIFFQAFPVLARILTEKKLLNTPVGLVAISAAAIDDAVAWYITVDSYVPYDI